MSSAQTEEDDHGCSCCDHSQPESSPQIKDVSDAVIGNVVKIFGLNNTKYNDLTATVIMLPSDTTNDRFALKLNDGKKILVKPENFVVGIKEKPDPVAVANLADFMRSASMNSNKTHTKQRVDGSLDIFNN
jgi:hypothetical protein